MLLSLRVANHRSLREEQQLLFSPVYGADRPDGTAREAVPVLALFGANASGKSNVVDALRFLAGMVRSSHQEAEPGSGLTRSPFLLDAEGVGDPSWYVVDLLLRGVRYTYGFSLDDAQILDEWLFGYPHGRRRTLFQRSADEYHFGDSMPKRELELVRSITAPNALFLSVAARSRQESVLPVYEWFQRALSFRGGGLSLPLRGRRRASWVIGEGGFHGVLDLLGDPDRNPAVVGLLRAADLGIEDAGVESVPVSPVEQEPQPALFGADGDSEPPSVRFREHLERRRVWIEHRGRSGPVRLGLQHESEGTRALLTQVAPVLNALAEGGVLVVDEIDSSLHPRLTAQVIRLFQGAVTNPHGAQLVLTTHDASLLGRLGGADVLKRDQVWFVEKNPYGETSLFPLSDFRPRQEENRQRRYLGGSYGAVPRLNDELFEAAVAARGGADDAEDAET